VCSRCCTHTQSAWLTWQRTAEVCPQTAVTWQQSNECKNATTVPVAALATASAAPLLGVCSADVFALRRVSCWLWQHTFQHMYNAGGPCRSQSTLLLFCCCCCLPHLCWQVGSVFEYFDKNAIFGVVQPDSPLWLPIIGLFAITGLPTAGADRSTGSMLSCSRVQCRAAGWCDTQCMCTA
jgi:hypothetical protein